MLAFVEGFPEVYTLPDHTAVAETHHREDSGEGEPEAAPPNVVPLLFVAHRLTISPMSPHVVHGIRLVISPSPGMGRSGPVGPLGHWQSAGVSECGLGCAACHPVSQPWYRACTAHAIHANAVSIQPSMGCMSLSHPISPAAMMTAVMVAQMFLLRRALAGVMPFSRVCVWVRVAHWRGSIVVVVGVGMLGIECCGRGFVLCVGGWGCSR